MMQIPLITMKDPKKLVMMIFMPSWNLVVNAKPIKKAKTSRADFTLFSSVMDNIVHDS